jgi:hypothetical protein
MKGDILSQWEQYLYRILPPITLPITLCTGTAAVWKFHSLFNEEFSTSWYVDFQCYYQKSQKAVPARMLEPWVDVVFYREWDHIKARESLPPEIPKSVCPGRWYCVDTYILFFEIDISKVFENNIYPPVY